MTIKGCTDGFPVNEVEGSGIPIFLFDDEGSEISGVAFVEQVGIKLAGRGVAVN